MDQAKLITSFEDFNLNKIFEEIENPLDVDETVLDRLVDLVGSEDDVEECAREAYEELKKAFERDEIAFEDDSQSPEALTMSALIVKLVEKGKLGPEEADSFIENN